MRISPMPMTNSGSAARIRVIVEVTWSAGRSRFIAVHTPIRIDSGIAMADATSTRNAELPTRSDSSWVTGCWVAAELPRIAVAASPGSAMTAANTTSDTSHSVRTPSPMRRAMSLDDTRCLLSARLELTGDELGGQPQMGGDQLRGGGVAAP